MTGLSKFLHTFRIDNIFFLTHLLICACDMDLDFCLRSLTSSEVATSRSSTGLRNPEMSVII